MSHQHHYACAHSSLRYCPTCKVTYCVECGQEWRDASTYTPTWIYSVDTAPTVTAYPPSSICHHTPKG